MSILTKRGLLCVCERLHCCHADEGGEIEIGDIDLIPMSVEIASN